MVERFVSVEINEDYYYCNSQDCEVVIFMCSVGGICPSCIQIGKRVGNEENQ